MPGEDDLGAQFGDPSEGGIEVLDFEPEQDSVAVRKVSVPDPSMVVGDVPGMELKDEDLPGDQLFVVVAAMRAAATQEALIPPAAGLDVTDTDEWLRAHAWTFSAVGRIDNPEGTD